MLEVRKEILERAARLLASTGHHSDEQHELTLGGLTYDVIIVRLLKDNVLLVFYDDAIARCVASSRTEIIPESSYVGQNTAEGVLELLRKNMVLDDIIDA